MKKVMALIFVFLLSINTFGAQVSDNDGSAFITKAEFDSLKNNFQSQIDQYNQSIDSKIDGAIAAYLAGLTISTEKSTNLMLWGDTTLGLVEDYRSHQYVEGTVGGKIELISWVSSNAEFYNGTSTVGELSSGNITYPTNGGYWCHCYHMLTANSIPFKYLVATYGQVGADVIWLMKGYGSVTDTIQVNTYQLINADYTANGVFTIGLCTGIKSTYGTAGIPLTKNSYTDALSMCETSIGTQYSARRTSSDRAWEKPRANNPGSVHNVYRIPASNIKYSSSAVYDQKIKYLTNYDNTSPYNDLWPSEWYGSNRSNGAETHTTTGDLYGGGWRLKETKGNENFHMKVNVLGYGTVPSGKHGSLYNCDNRAFMRKFKTGTSDVTSTEWRSGWIWTGGSTQNHYTFPNEWSYKKMFKASTSDWVNAGNLYSDELGAALKTKLPALVKTANVEGQTMSIAPLYIGLPLGEVKESDKVRIELDFLDSTSYDVGFYIDGFPEGSLSSSEPANAGCTIAGTTSHIKSIDGPKTQETIELDITKSGILFMKFGATTTTTKGTIKLPSQFSIISNG